MTKEELAQQLLRSKGGTKTVSTNSRESLYDSLINANKPSPKNKVTVSKPSVSTTNRPSATVTPPKSFTNSLRSFWGDVQKVGIGGAIADRLIPSKDRQPQAVAEKNVQTFVQKPLQEAEVVERTGRQGTAGFVGAISPVLDFMAFAHSVDKDTMNRIANAKGQPKLIQTVAKNYGDMQGSKSESVANISGKVKELESKISVKDPNAIDEVVKAFGSTLAFFVAGIASGGASLPTLLETYGNMGEVVQRTEGKPIDERNKRVLTDGVVNGVVNYFTNKFGLFSTEEVGLKKILNGFMQEAFQEGEQALSGNITSTDAWGEYWQKLIENKVEKKPMFSGTRPLVEEMFQGVGESTLLGGIMGSMFSLADLSPNTDTTVEEKDEKKATKVEETRTPTNKVDNITKAPEPAKAVAKAEVDPLIAQARKYKSAGEFKTDILGNKNNFKIYEGSTDLANKESFAMKAVEKNREIVQKKLIEVADLKQKGDLFGSETKMREAIDLAGKSNKVLSAFESEFGSYRQPYDLRQMKSKIVGGLREDQLKYSENLARLSASDEPINVYRAIDSTTIGSLGGNKIYAGDFVSADREYVKQFGDIIIEDKLPKSDLRTVSGSVEMIYNPKSQLTDIWNQAQPTKGVDPLIEEARKYKSAEEFMSNYKKVFHQTSPESAQAIEKEGFKTGIKGSGYGDFLPEGINTKSTGGEIPLRGRGMQIEAFFDSKSRVQRVKDRDGATRLIIENDKSGEYEKLLDEMDFIDNDAVRRVDALEKEFHDSRGATRVPGERDAYFKSRNIDLQKMLQEGSDKSDEVAQRAKKVATRVLRDMGVDVLHIEKDVGGWSGKLLTDNFIVLNPKALKTKSQLTDIWNQAQPTKGVDPLIEEARKYKSAEEFVNEKLGLKKQDSYSVRVGKEGSLQQEFNVNAPDVATAKKIAVEDYLQDMRVRGRVVSSVSDKDVVILNAPKNGKDLIDFKIKNQEQQLTSIREKAKTSDFYKKLEKGHQENLDKLKAQRQEVSQLTDIWNQAQPTKGVDPLLEEARKYKSAEEFVKAQGQSVFRGGDTAIDTARGSGRGISVSDKETAGLFTPPEGGLVDEAILPKTAKILKEGDIPKNLQDAYIKEAQVLADPKNFSTALQKSVIEKQQAIIEYARKNGFDAVDFPFEKEIRVVKPNVLKTKSQLTDIWNKAQPTKGVEPLIEEARKYKSAEEFVKNISKTDPNAWIGDKLGLEIKDGSILKGGEAIGELNVRSNGDSISLSNIKLYEKNTGLGSSIVNSLKEYADITGKNFNIDKAYNRGFWSKFGFEDMGGKDYLRYEPKFNNTSKSQLIDIWNQAQTDTISEADKKDFEDMGLKVPEDAKSTKTTTIPEAEKQIQDTYTASQDKVDQAFSEVFAEMEIAEAGRRIFLDQPDSSQRKVVGVKSTFPDWIPEDLRSRKLFDAVMGGMSGDVTKLKFPDKNKTKQRQLYNEILAEVDKRSGVDTSEARSAILDLYEKPVQKQEAKQATKPADRSSTRREETTAEEKLEEKVEKYLANRTTKFRTQREMHEAQIKGLAEEAKRYETPEDFYNSLRPVQRDILRAYGGASTGNQKIYAFYARVTGKKVQNRAEDLNKAPDIDYSLESDVVREYGITDNPDAGAFITSDGEFINGGLNRVVDHREMVSDVTEGGGTDGLIEYMAKTTNIRIINTSSGEANVDLVYYPNNAQMEALMSLVEGKSVIYADVSRPDGTVKASGEFSNTDKFLKFLEKEAPDADTSTKFRVKDDVAKITGKKITDEQEAELIALNKRIFGDDNVKITLQIMANKKALGAYQGGIIQVLDGQVDPKETLYHEAVHKYIDVFTTRGEQVELFKAGIEKYGTDDLLVVEEKLAEDFISYAKSREGITGKIKSIFDSILARINAYLGNADAIDKLYQDILSPAESKLAKAQEAGLPVGQGKTKESAFLERVKEQLLSTDPASYEFDEQTGKYNEMNLEENAQRATDFIVSNPKEAIAVSLGLINPPQGVTANAIGLGTMLKARDEKNFNLYRDIATSVTLRSTRLGQEIVSLRGQMNDNSPENFVKRAINARMKNISKSLLKDVEVAGRSLSDTKKEVTKKIDEETVKLKKKLSKDKIKIQKAQDIIDALRC